jgi:hypothetical protein
MYVSSPDETSASALPRKAAGTEILLSIVGCETNDSNRAQVQGSTRVTRGSTERWRARRRAKRLQLAPLRARRPGRALGHQLFRNALPSGDAARHGSYALCLRDGICGQTGGGRQDLCKPGKRLKRNRNESAERVRAARHLLCRLWTTVGKREPRRTHARSIHRHGAIEARWKLETAPSGLEDERGSASICARSREVRRFPLPGSTGRRKFACCSAIGPVPSTTRTAKHRQPAGTM